MIYKKIFSLSLSQSLPPSRSAPVRSVNLSMCVCSILFHSVSFHSISFRFVYHFVTNSWRKNETEWNRMKQNETECHSVSFWNGLKWNKSEQTHTDRSALNGAERNWRKVFYIITCTNRAERNGEWNGMEWNETERNRMKQNETEWNGWTNTHGPFRSERSGAGAVRARAFVLFSKSPSPRLGLGLEPDPALQK